MSDLPDSYREVLGRLSRLRPCKRPQTWKARCPAHEDNNPSLLVWVASRTGCLCARCLAGKCDFAAIVRATGTELAAWFPPKDSTRRRPMSERREVARYKYTDEDGNTLAVKVRYEPKSFCWFTPTQGGLVPGREGVRVVLYNLHDVHVHTSQPVIVAEGEKKVEMLRSLDLLATSGPDGSGSWPDELGRTLRGRRVAIIPDNDAPGLRHAWQVAGNLLYWGAASIRVVHLPGMPQGGGLDDWLNDTVRFAKPDTFDKDQARWDRANDKDKRASLVHFIKAAPEWRRTGEVEAESQRKEAA